MEPPDFGGTATADKRPTNAATVKYETIYRKAACEWSLCTGWQAGAKWLPRRRGHRRREQQGQLAE